MSIVVIYEGQRKAIKVSSPNTLVQLIVAEAAEHFKVIIIITFALIYALLLLYLIDILRWMYQKLHCNIERVCLIHLSLLDFAVDRITPKWTSLSAKQLQAVNRSSAA